MIDASQIREHLVDLLASNENQEAAVSLFEDWLIEASWNMHLNSDVQAQQLAGEIQLYLAEMDAEGLGYDWLWRKLKAVLSAHSLSFSISREQIHIATRSSTVFSPQQWVFSPAGSQRAVACG
jgi:hypothetical protein